MIRFLHFVYDDKFAKGAVFSFNKEPDIDNRYIYYNRRERINYAKS